MIPVPYIAFSSAPIELELGVLFYSLLNLGLSVDSCTFFGATSLREST